MKKYIVLKTHAHLNGMHKKGTEQEYPDHVAKVLLGKAIIAEPIVSELKEIKKKTTRKRKTTK